MRSPIGAMVRRYFPDATEEDIGYIIWNHTGYPVFFAKGVTLEMQVKEYAEALKPGIPLCEYCNRPAEHVGHYSALCGKCYKAFDSSIQEMEL